MTKKPVGYLLLSLAIAGIATATDAQVLAKDPGVRGGVAGAGGAIAGLTATEAAFFKAGLADFIEVEEVDEGLGPRFNLTACGGCHVHPAIGGSSGPNNPQFALGVPGYDRVPSFITEHGAIREARFIQNRSDGTRDGGVHSLFTISGREGAAGCVLAQPDFEAEVAALNVTFRIPTPLFGAGLIEQIPDSVLLANMAANANDKLLLGIGGRPNIILAANAITGEGNKNGNDGTIGRFGWKAQNKSLLLFSGEAYNVEMGITNELFQTERDETPQCQFARVPNDVTNTAATIPTEVISAIERFAFFQRFLAPPTPVTTLPGVPASSITNGRNLFTTTGCHFCHTPTLMTGDSTVAALRKKPANLFSDLLLHRMGTELNDGIVQGQAGAGEFRTSPLWGLGQRIFFLHDGRTTDLLAAILAHKGEANKVIARFNTLTEPQKQDLLNFLRSL